MKRIQHKTNPFRVEKIAIQDFDTYATADGEVMRKVTEKQIQPGTFTRVYGSLENIEITNLFTSKVVLDIVKKVTKEGTVILNAADYNSKSPFYKAIDELCEKNLLAKAYERNLYYVNMNYITKSK